MLSGGYSSSLFPDQVEAEAMLGFFAGNNSTSNEIDQGVHHDALLLLGGNRRLRPRNVQFIRRRDRVVPQYALAPIARAASVLASESSIVQAMPDGQGGYQTPKNRARLCCFVLAIVCSSNQNFAPDISS